MHQTPTCGSYCRQKYFRDDYVGMLYVDCDEVYPNIFIGDGTTAKNKDFLKKLGITHVLNTAEGKAFSMVNTNGYFYKDVGIKYMGFQLLDHPSVKISEYFHVAADFIQNAINSNGIVYVHCLMGKSRSSTCVLAYLMIKLGMSAAEALRTVKKKRAIYPNEGFLQQLADLDNFLKKRRYENAWCY
ncbi:dual specificity protein phosphatase, putative [Pediculus humanus corporis]|uniref:Dual specificity protein phosphatase n=1 Tax=Pediculus humanus subsp. corporis TaxID=121224 RepID=E0VGA9_PEDHC|nr:dual specificity protein phosphatase, putative [Pediculus humanus corporis]EEB12415.1 dual specificity protein phosphatase, putative [Pediculus humanus corporis]